MPRGNPHPVVKGRNRGVPNKFSVVRAERVEAAGKKLPPDELLRNAEDCRAMAGRYAPMRTDKTTGGAAILIMTRSAIVIGWQQSAMR